MLGEWRTRNRAYERDEQHKARCRLRAAEQPGSGRLFLKRWQRRVQPTSTDQG